MKTILLLLCFILYSLNAQPTYIDSVKLGLDKQDFFADISQLKTSNDLIIASNFYNSTNYGGTNFTSQGEADIILSRQTPSLTHIWSTSFYGDNSDQAIALEVDSLDNIILGAITYSPSLNIGSIALIHPGTVGTAVVVLVKLNSSSGDVIWSQAYGGTGDALLNDVTVDSSNNIFFCGSFKNSADFGGGSINSNSSGADWIIAKYSAAGTFVWNQKFGGNFDDFALGITVDPSSQDVIIVGNYLSNDLIIGGVQLPNLGSYDTLMVRLESSSGNLIWYKTWGSVGDDYLSSVVADSVGSILSLGGCGGALTPSLPCQAGVWILKLNSNGDYLLSKNFNSSTTNFEYSPKIAVGTEDAFYAVGHYKGSTSNIDGVVLPQSATNDYGSYIASFHSDGTLQWAEGYVSSILGEIVLRSLVVDSTGAVFYGGWFTGNLTLGGPVLSTAEDDFDTVLLSVQQPSPSPSPSAAPSSSPSPSASASSSVTPTPSSIVSVAPSTSPTHNHTTPDREPHTNEATPLTIFGGIAIAFVFAGIVASIFWCCTKDSQSEVDQATLQLELL